jgi:Flp pilus assembly protein TadD
VAVSRSWRPAIFGIFWFLLGILPGALLVRPYVESDTRMFLPFIGIALSVTWAARMLLPSGPPLRRLEAIVATGLLLALGYGTFARNRIWSSEESLWQDAIAKHPQSVHALENYALAIAETGRAAQAYEYLRKARQLAPFLAEVEANLGTVCAMLHRSEEAEQHLRRGLSVGADKPVTHFAYGEFLEKEGQREKAIDSFNWASSLASTDMRPRIALMRLYTAGGEWNNLRDTVEAAGKIAPGDPAVSKYAEVVRNHPDTLKGAEQLALNQPTAENYVALSEKYCFAGEYTKCLEAGQKALQLHPGMWQAYNVVGAAYMSLGRLDEAIEAAKQGLLSEPENKILRTNLAVWQNERLVAGSDINRK